MLEGAGVVGTDTHVPAARRAYQGTVLVLVSVLLGLQLRAVVGPHEDWPFTSAPMFARYHTPGAPAYELGVVVREVGGAPFELVPKQHLGVGELAFRRQLFTRHYGSVDARHPGGHHVADDATKFERRMSAWCKLVANANEVKMVLELASLRVELRGVGPTAALARPLLDYDVANERLTPHPRPAR
jgi:hypothetical protein